MRKHVVVDQAKFEDQGLIRNYINIFNYDYSVCLQTDEM